jgi:hypothetical protein
MDVFTDGLMSLFFLEFVLVLVGFQIPDDEEEEIISYEINIQPRTQGCMQSVHYSTEYRKSTLTVQNSLF